MILLSPSEITSSTYNLTTYMWCTCLCNVSDVCIFIFFSEPSTRFCTHVLREYFMCSCLSEGVLFLQHRKQSCMNYSLNAGGERERCIRPRCSEQANDQSHRLEQNQSIQIRTHPLPRVRNDPFSKSSCILHLIVSVCYDTFIRALNTGYVKMLLSNLKIILRG